MESRRWRDGRWPGQRGGTLLGMALGLVVGVLVSFGVVWFLNKSPLPFVEHIAKPEAKTNGANGTAEQSPVALPGKPGDKPVERKFEFYDILEGKKTTPPQTDDVPAAPAEPADAAATPAPGRVLLQAGAFQKSADAENLKARLAMLGFEAHVLEAEVPDKGMMYRVRTGPYASTEEMNRVRGQLSQNDIRTTVVRSKD